MPRSGRVAFYAAALAVLGVTYALSESDGLQLLALCVLFFGVLPALGRRLGRRDEAIASLDDLVPPFRVMAPTVAFWIAWIALVVLVPDLGLGPWFWFSVAVVPGAEVQMYLAERDLRRRGAETWGPFRPVWHSALCGLAVTPILIAMELLDDVAPAEAVGTGVACGFIVFTIGVTFAWLIRRANADDRGTDSLA